MIRVKILEFVEILKVQNLDEAIGRWLLATRPEFLEFDVLFYLYRNYGHSALDVFGLDFVDFQQLKRINQSAANTGDEVLAREIVQRMSGLHMRKARNAVVSNQHYRNI